MQSKFLAPAAAALIAVALATGCSKSADSSSSTSTADATAAPAASDSAMSSSSSSSTQAVAAAGDPAKGEAIFSANCAGCHGAKGAGGGVGPSLVNEKSRKDDAAAIAWIKNPQPPMPKLYPSPLSQTDVENVAAYVESL